MAYGRAHRPPPGRPSQGTDAATVDPNDYEAVRAAAYERRNRRIGDAWRTPSE
jgi:hypothetical protein